MTVDDKTALTFALRMVNRVKEPEKSLLIKAEEVAQILGVSVRSVWRLHSAGRMPAPVRFAGSVRWRRTQVEQWIDEGCPVQDNGS
jgi:excisionase family DNA binding protein